MEKKKVLAQVNRTKLNKIFSVLKAGVFPKERFEIVHCELTVFSGRVELNAPWGKYSLEAVTAGAARATFPLKRVSEIIRTFKDSEIFINIHEGALEFNSFLIKVDTCFFENDKILRSIELPVNSTDIDLLKLLSGKYTYQELDFNKLWAPAVSAENRLKSALNASYRKLKAYGVSYQELEQMVKKKIVSSDYKSLKK
jgi:hypothetical protein